MINLLLFFLSLFSMGISYADNEKNFDTMVVFGDSLSDNGNLYNFLWYTLPASPPYYLGRFSNGLVWAEQLYNAYFPEDYTEGLQNYAVGGAGAVLSYREEFPYTLVMELDNYFYWHTYGKKETTLFSIWIGANNYLNAPSNTEAITDSVVNAIGGSVERLIQAGGTKFFIANLPDLALTPYAHDYGTQVTVNKLVVMHNEKLAVKVNELKEKYPAFTFVYFDVYSFLNEALEHPSVYGFSNTQDPCYFGGYIEFLAKSAVNEHELQRDVTQLNPQFDGARWASIANNPQLNEAASVSYLYQFMPKQLQDDVLYCDEHLFWDRIHPSTKAHAVIAEKAQQLITEAGLTSFVPDKTPVPG